MDPEARSSRQRLSTAFSVSITGSNVDGFAPDASLDKAEYWDYRKVGYHPPELILPPSPKKEPAPPHLWPSAAIVFSPLSRLPVSVRRHTFFHHAFRSFPSFENLIHFEKLEYLIK